MAKKINFEKHIYEGWCVKHFIEELQPCMDMVMRGESWHKPFQTRERMKNIYKYGNISIVLKFLFCTFAAEYKIKMPMER